MAYLNANIPTTYAQIRREYLYDLKKHHGEVEDCIIFGLSSLGGRAILFHCIMENGAIYYRLPISAFIQRGFDPKTGMPFNTMRSPGVTPLDAGHFKSHISNPELSNDPYNIGYQNQYENKGQSAAEKLAGQQGREATDEELADMIFKSIINRTVEDVQLPRKGKARDAFMSPINAKLQGMG